MLDLLFTNPFAFVVVIGAILIAIAIHEAAHCYMADYLGDPTPRSLGRLTLNPLAHLDPLGTIMIIVTGGFGWGKASPFDPYNLRHPDRDTALIALAGPTSNILIAVLISIALHLLPLQPIAYVLIFIMRLNIGLALFNLIPVPPLDGSKIFFKHSYSTNYLLLLILIFPIFNGSSLASLIVSPISNLLLRFLV